MLTIHQISSHDARGAAKYFESVVESERQALEQLGSYYESGLGRGGMAFGDDAALLQLGVHSPTVSGRQLERMLEGKTATRPNPVTEPERFEVDVDRLAMMLRKDGVREAGRAVGAAIDQAREKGRSITAAEARWYADRAVAARAITESKVPMKERLVRTAGRSLDHAALRKAIDEAVVAKGGLSKLDVETRSSVETLRAMELGDKRHPDRKILRHARVLEAGDLIRVKDHMRATVNSQDLTLSAPKSVSVLWAASSSDRRRAIEQAVEASAHASIDYMSRSVACLQRRTEDGAVVMEKAHGFAGTSYLHFTARGVVEADVADPQLHVHCIVSGVLRSDGMLVAPNQREWVRHGREGGAFFRSDLAERLRALGIAIEQHTGKDGRYFEVAGVPRELCDAMSQRSRVIEEAIEQFKRDHHGRSPSPEERDAIVVRTRLGKGATAIDLDGRWQEMCAEHGLDAKAVERIFGRRQLGIDRGDARLDNARNEVVERMHQRGSTVTDREVRAIAYEATAGALAPHKVMKLVDDMQRDGVLITLDGGLVTTMTVLEAEQACLDLADRTIRPIHPRSVERGIEIAGATSGFALSAEQRTAVEYALGERGVSAVVGLPGSGKGTVIRAVSAAVAEDGGGVVAIATQGARASGVGGQSLSQSRTVASVLAAMQRDALMITDGRGVRRPARAGDTIILDEAGMVDTFTMHQLMHEADQRDMRLVLIGDPKQLDAIGVSGILEPLAEACAAPQLNEVYRTRHEWLLQMQTHIRAGESELALEVMRTHDAAHLFDTSDESIDAMLAAWNDGRQLVGDDQAVMLVHSSNRVVDDVNVRAQQMRREAGELGTAAVRAPDRAYALHEGDRVMFREQPYLVPGQRRVENGTRGEVVRVDPRRKRVTVRLHEPNCDPRDVVVDTRKCAALRLSYASHVFPAQGDTYERTYELAGGHGTGSAASYVGASRTRERHDLFTSRDVLEGATDAECWQVLADQMNERARKAAAITFDRADRRIASSVPPTRLERLEQIAMREQRRVQRLEAHLEDAMPRDARPRVEQRRRAHGDVVIAQRTLASANADLDVVRTQTVVSEPGRAAKRRRIDECREHVAAARESLDQADARLARADAALLRVEGGGQLTSLHARLDEARVARDRAVHALQAETRLHPPAFVQRTLRSRPMEPSAGQRWDEHVNELVDLRVQTQSRTVKAPMRRRAMEREGRALLQRAGIRRDRSIDLER